MRSVTRLSLLGIEGYNKGETDMSKYFDIEDLVAAVRDHGNIEPEAWSDIAMGGADSGWSGFIYTRDCVNFYDDHTEMLWEMLADEAEEFGHTVLEHMSQFGAQNRVVSDVSFKVLVSHWALECAAHAVENEVVELKEEGEDEND